MSTASLEKANKSLYFVAGNPKYEVKKGIIEFYEDVGVEIALVNGDEAPVVRRNSLELNGKHLQCIVSVPSFMIHQVNFL
jgi:hypothetical protein